MLEQGGRVFLSVSQDVISLVPRRFRYKPKWATQLKSKSNCQRALDHFDAFYKPVYSDQWPSIRLSLLSLQKYCAVLNRFSDKDKVSSKLENIGCLDFLQSFKVENTLIQPSASSVSDYYSHLHSLENLNEKVHESVSQNSSLDSQNDLEFTSEYELNRKQGPSHLHYVVNADRLEPFDEDMYKHNLDAFVPPEQVLTDREKLMEEEVQVVSFQSRDVDVEVIPMEPISIPKELQVYVFQPGDVSRFPQPKAYNQRTGYYLMDAASVMPVIAMNLNSTDRVLDLCAAPGGKSFSMLQALNLDKGAELHCNDISQSRITRLKTILSSHLPHGLAELINVTHMDGVAFQSHGFDKILVDVPCNSDRHVVTEDDNNLFKISRTKERLKLMHMQTNLLLSAIKLCAVGGCVVYSTCTLAPAQNDGVIQAAVEVLARKTEIKVAVEDLSPLGHAFKEHFRFFDKCRYGQLILPSLTNNFGPTYFAKLRRIK